MGYLADVNRTASKRGKRGQAKGVKSSNVKWCFNYPKCEEANCQMKTWPLIDITKDGTIGRCAVVEVDFPFCINQSVAVIQPDAKKVTPTFLTSYLLYPTVVSKIQNMGKGQALKHLQITELAKLAIPLPPLPLQMEFAKRLVEIRELEAKQSASRKRLDDLFQSMLHRAFSGTLWMTAQN